MCGLPWNFEECDQSNTLSSCNVKFMKHLPLTNRGMAYEYTNRWKELEISDAEACLYWSSHDTHQGLK